ncbi:hypothetical protein HRbin32_01875 [bacterium HR32]|jgi:putative copper resistance protein D|nr:hypothetical protein HRbin32_01875 [bacterium HR32]
MTDALAFLHGPLPGRSASALAWVVLVAGLLLVAYGLRAGVRTAEGRAFFLAGLVAALLSGSAVARAVADVASTVPARNPVPPSPESLARGEQLYRAHCQVCHGPHGAGDGPAAAALPTRPADLRVHVPMHADGHLFLWISSGVPGTPMPAFADRLTEEERWHVVNYLRVLALTGR